MSNRRKRREKAMEIVEPKLVEKRGGFDIQDKDGHTILSWFMYPPGDPKRKESNDNEEDR